jgi:methanogenic corrinoid protein MtbC1
MTINSKDLLRQKGLRAASAQAVGGARVSALVEHQPEEDAQTGKRASAVAADASISFS